MACKLLVVWVGVIGHDCRAGVKEGKDGDEDDQMDVSCFPERKTLRRRQETVHNTPLVECVTEIIRRRRCRGNWGL